jgi:glycosyltransferase involved in cell wall biosynthesis
MRIGVDARNLVPNLSGIGRYVLEMCKALSARGHTLVLYFPERPKHDLPDIKNCLIRISNYRGPIRRILWSKTQLPATANADELDLFWGPAHRLPSGLNQNIPKVLTIHDLVWRHASETMRWQTWIGELLFMRPSLRLADHIIAVSHATQTDLIKDYPATESKVSVIYPGLSALPMQSAIKDEALKAWHIDRPYALFVGTLEPRKNLKRLLEAFADLPANTKDRLLLVIAGGQGWHLNNLSQIIRENKIEQFVRITGFVKDQQLADLYAFSEFLLMPSLYEGFGFPIIEAQSYGEPVITSNISSMPEVAKAGALLVDPYNRKSLTHAMQKLAVNSEIRFALTANATSNAARFSWQKASIEMEQIFELLT